LALLVLSFVLPVDFAEGDDLLDVMRSVDALFLELAAIGFGVRAKVQKGQEQGMQTSLLTLGLEFLEVVGMGKTLAAVVTAGMDGDEFFVVKEQQLVGQDFQGQPLGGIKVRHGIAIGLEDKVAATVDVGGLNGRAVIGHWGQRFEQGFLRFETGDGFLIGLAENTNVGGQ